MLENGYSELAVILQSALSRNRDERKSAEGRLLQVEYAPQHLVRLLQVIVNTDFNLAVRHLASISLKNFIVDNWVNCSGEQSTILPDDKAAVRENTLNIVARVPPLLRAQLRICLETIINVDYPQQWPGLLHWVKQKLQGQDIYGAVFVLRLIFKRFKLEKRRTLAIHIVDETFPGLVNIFKRNVEISNPAIEVADLVKLICKIFLSAINARLPSSHSISSCTLGSIDWVEIPKMLVDPYVLKAWTVCFLNLLEKSVPLDGKPADLEQGKSWGWWKVKKWTVHILNCLSKFFIGGKNSDYKAVAVSFQNKFAVKILDCYLKLLDGISVGGYVPDIVISCILQFITISISERKVYYQMELRLDVLFEAIFPLMCFDDYDQILWDEDPHEYVYKQSDFRQYPTPRSTAFSFLRALIKENAKKNLPKFLVFFYKVCRRYNEAAAEQKLSRQKDGALAAIGCLLDYLRFTELFKSELELILVQHVFPEFQSSVGHLRAKAAFISGLCTKSDFKDSDNFRHAVQGVVSGIYDTELPVRVVSVVALCCIVGDCKDFAEIRSIVPQSLDAVSSELFKVTIEVGIEDSLVHSLLKIVEKFGEEIAPHAIGLCHNLYTSTGLEAAEDEAAAAATSCLRAISAILEAVSSHPELFPPIEPALLPIMHRMLNRDVEDFFDGTFEIISCLTSFSPTISLEIWSLLPPIIEALTDWGLNLHPSSFAPLANYISRGTAHYLSCKEPDYQQSIWTFISTIMGYTNLEDDYMMIAPKLIQVIFQNCRGQVDQWVDPYLTITLKCLLDTEKPQFKCLLIKVVAAALYYNAQLALDAIRKHSVCTEVLNIWFQLLQETEKSGMLANFKRKEDKKVCCLGLLSLLALPTDQLPVERIFKAAIDILIAYKDQVLLEVGRKEDGDDGMKKSRGFAEWAAQSDDDEDPFIFFLDTCKAMQESDSLRFENLMQTLDLNYHENASVVAQHAEKRRVERLQEKRRVESHYCLSLSFELCR